MDKEPILSICIPTYNSAEDIFKKAEDILSVKSNLFQLVISDNHSSDDTLKRLSAINDDRLKVVALDDNKGSIYNIASAYANSDGKFAMICMDKDIVKPERIEEAIKILGSSEVNFGYFELDTDNENIKDAVSLSESVEDCLLKFAYKALHPSGTFFKKELITDFCDYHLADEKIVGGFITDFMLAEASLSGNGAVIDLSLIETVKPPFKGKKHSYTYSPQKNNVFFEPEQRFVMLEKYIKHLKSLSLDSALELKVLNQAVFTTFIHSTESYAYILKQKNICDWYNVEARDLSKKELKNICFDFIKKLSQSNFYQNTDKKKKILKKLIKKAKISFIDKVLLRLLICKGDV